MTSAATNRDDRSGRIRIVVLPNITATNMNSILKENAALGSTLYMLRFG